MVIILNQNDFFSYPDLLEEMNRSMTTPFPERHKWCPASGSMPEKDEFDSGAALYLMSVSDDHKTLYCSCRLLPTSGPHMMSKVFGAHFGPDAILRTPLIWEITRFCRSRAVHRAATPGGLYFPVVELLAGICELGMRCGMSHATMVFAPLAGRIFRRAGLGISILGVSDSLGKEPLLAGLWELDRRTVAALRKSGGFRDSVLSAVPLQRPAGRPGQAA